MVNIDVDCLCCTKAQGVICNGHLNSGAQLYRCKLCLKIF